jgi:hypothetical protein
MLSIGVVPKRREEKMHEDWVVSLIVTWLPFILLCAVALRHGRHIRNAMTTPDGRSIAQVWDDLARELKRANDLRVADSQRASVPP